MRMCVLESGAVTDDVRAYWDDQAAAFDAEPDHGLRDPAVRAAWAKLLDTLMPPPPAHVTDLGCGTGSVAVLLAQRGHPVRGLDLSPRMVDAAAVKAAAAGVTPQFVEGDASSPPYEPASTDVVFARHVLWALPDSAAALARWIRLLRPDGRLVLIEGRWDTGAGIPAHECQALVRAHRREADVTLLDNAALWGRAITDERYAVLSRE
jgi:ubiquinone/menaquinone biosynthesis C-methylase UbiE